MDAVTGLSGSGPAYVFYLIDVLAAAGHKQGLDKELAMKLAKMTVLGEDNWLLVQRCSREIEVNVTSPNGTTEAGLNILMNSENGLGLLSKKRLLLLARSEGIVQMDEITFNEFLKVIFVWEVY